jgi:serine/threonine protein kinase
MLCVDLEAEREGPSGSTPLTTRDAAPTALRRWSVSPDEGSPSVVGLPSNEQVFSRDGVPRYRRLAILGHGSQGTAYLVDDLLATAAGERLVLKKVPHRRSGGERAGHREAGALATLAHPCIVRYHASWSDEATTSILMEHVDGCTLRELIERLTADALDDGQPALARPSENELLDWAAQLLLALAHAHRHRLIHRDVKASNVCITPDGRLKLIDFGAAKALAAGDDALAQTCIGTPYYLAPEVISGQGYDAKADVWAAGVVLYQAATLRVPFAADNLPALALKILAGNYPPLDGASPRLHALIRRCLEPDPAMRPSAEELLSAPALVHRAAAFMTATLDAHDCPAWSHGARSRSGSLLASTIGSLSVALAHEGAGSVASSSAASSLAASSAESSPAEPPLPRRTRLSPSALASLHRIAAAEAAIAAAAAAAAAADSQAVVRLYREISARPSSAASRTQTPIGLRSRHRAPATGGDEVLSNAPTAPALPSPAPTAGSSPTGKFAAPVMRWRALSLLRVVAPADDDVSPHARAARIRSAPVAPWARSAAADCSAADGATCRVQLQRLGDAPLLLAPVGALDGAGGACVRTLALGHHRLLLLRPVAPISASSAAQLPARGAGAAAAGAACSALARPLAPLAFHAHLLELAAVGAQLELAAGEWVAVLELRFHAPAPRADGAQTPPRALGRSARASSLALRAPTAGVAREIVAALRGAVGAIEGAYAGLGLPLPEFATAALGAGHDDARPLAPPPPPSPHSAPGTPSPLARRLGLLPPLGRFASAPLSSGPSDPDVAAACAARRALVALCSLHGARPSARALKCVERCAATAAVEVELGECCEGAAGGVDALPAAEWRALGGALGGACAATLRALTCARVRLSSEAVGALASALEAAPKLERLALCHHELQAEAVQGWLDALRRRAARPAGPPLALAELALSGGATPTAVRALAELVGELPRGLRRLELTDCALARATGGAGRGALAELLAALAAPAHAGALRGLSLARTDGVAGAQLYATLGACAPTLSALNLAGCALDVGRACAALRAGGAARALRALELSANCLADGAHADELCSLVGACKALRSLRLCGMRAMSAEALGALAAAALGNDALGALALDVSASASALNPAGAAALARALRATPDRPTFSRLLLDGHAFGGAATTELLLALRGQPLAHLALDGALCAATAGAGALAALSPTAVRPGAPAAMAVSPRMQAVVSAYARPSRPSSGSPSSPLVLPPLVAGGARARAATPAAPAAPHALPPQPRPPQPRPLDALLDALATLVAAAPGLGVLSLAHRLDGGGAARGKLAAAAAAAPLPQPLALERAPSASAARRPRGGAERSSPTLLDGSRARAWARLLEALAASDSLQVLNVGALPLAHEEAAALRRMFEASGSLLVLECSQGGVSFKPNWREAFAALDEEECASQF